MDRLLTVQELAERLGISPGTAYHWLSQGRLPAVRFSKRCVRFRESDVEQLLDQLRNSDADPERNAQSQKAWREKLKSRSRTKTDESNSQTKNE
jgi:excisionase family DNA binding protein